MKNTILTAIGLTGSVIANLLGGFDMAIQTLLIFMATDYITGYAVGAMGKSLKTETGALSSKVGWKGLCKKGVTLLMVIVSAQLDRVMGTDIVRNAVVIAYISNELISIVENLGLMGAYIPAPLKKAIDILNKKSEGDGNA